MSEAKSEVDLDQSNKPVSTDQGDLERIVEAAFFATDETLSIRQLQAMFPKDAVPSADELRDVINQLQQRYADRGIELTKAGKGWRFQTREIYADWISKLFREKPPRYSRALMETLSIITYRQPVTRGEIEEIRGIAVSSDMIRTLMERGWIRGVGHRDVPGRPELLGTTDEFLQYFDLSSLKELPELAERRELQEVARDSNLELPLTEQESDTEQEASDEASLADVIELPVAEKDKAIDTADDEPSGDETDTGEEQD